MKKGITPEAARRLAVFMKGRRAQQGFDPEEGSLGDYSEDVLWESAKKMERTFTDAADSMKDAVEQAVQSALPSVEAFFSETFDAQVAEMSDLVSSAHQGVALPSSQELEQLKQQFLFDLRQVFTEKLSEWLAQPSSDPSMGGYEVRSLFGDAADRGVTP